MKTLLVIALCLVVSCSEVLGSTEEELEIKGSCENLPLAILGALTEKTFKKDGSVDLASLITELDNAFVKGKAGKERRRMQMLVRRLLQGERRTAKDVKRDTLSNEDLAKCTLSKLIDVAAKGLDGKPDVVCKTAQSELENGRVDTKAFLHKVDTASSTHDVFGAIGTFVNSFSKPHCGFLYLMKALTLERPEDK